MKKVIFNLVLSTICLSHAIIKPSSTARFFYQLIVLLVMMINLSACNEDEPDTAAIQFTSDVTNVSEGAQATITVKLDKPALSDVSIEIQVATSAVYDKQFITYPALHNGFLTLSIRRGKTAAGFLVTSLSDKQYDKGKIIDFTLSSASEGLHLGTSVTSRLFIDDDESSCLAYFEFSEESLAENKTAGTVVQALLPAPAKEDETITVNLGTSDAVYGIDFITVPGATNNTIELPVKQAATNATFTVLPIDNDLFKGNLNVPFVISSVNGTLQNDIEYVLTIDDDELPSVAHFALEEGSLSQDDATGFNVEILLSNKAAGSGKLTVSIDNGGYGTKFITEPAETGSSITLDILPGATRTGFKILPIKGAVCGKLEFFVFISEVSGVVKKNDPNSFFQMTILGNEGSTVSFAQNTGYISENNNKGIAVQLNLSQPAPDDYTINVYSPQVPSYTVYYTFPAVMTAPYYSPYIPVKVTAGTTQSEFTIFPIDNYSAGPDRSLKFYLTNNSVMNYNGCLAASDTFSLTIEDNDL